MTNPPSPPQKAAAALEQLRAHRLRDDAELISELEAHQEKSRRAFVQALSGGVFLVVALLAGALGFIPPGPGRFAVLCLSVIAGAGTVLVVSRHLHAWKNVSQAQAQLRQGKYNDYRFPKLLGSEYSLEPIDTSKGWFGLSSEVSDFPELARIWASWLVSDKTLRSDDCHRLREAVSLMRDAEKWEKQQLIEQETGQDAQAQFRASALNQLAPEVVAQVKQERLEGLLEPGVAPARPKARM